MRGLFEAVGSGWELIPGVFWRAWPRGPEGEQGSWRQAAVRAGNASGIPGSGKRAGHVEEFSQLDPSRPTQL